MPLGPSSAPPSTPSHWPLRGSWPPSAGTELCLAHPCNLGPEPLVPLIPTTSPTSPGSRAVLIADIPADSPQGLFLGGSGLEGLVALQTLGGCRPGCPEVHTCMVVQVHGPACCLTPTRQPPSDQGKAPAITGLLGTFSFSGQLPKPKAAGSCGVCDADPWADASVCPIAVAQLRTRGRYDRPALPPVHRADQLALADLPCGVHTIRRGGHLGSGLLWAPLGGELDPTPGPALGQGAPNVG